MPGFLRSCRLKRPVPRGKEALQWAFCPLRLPTSNDQGGESGRVAAFRPRTCVHALSQEGRHVVLPPLSFVPLAKLPVFRAAPGLAGMPYEAGLCPDAVGCGPLSSVLAEPYLESTAAGQCKVPGSRCPSACQTGAPSQLGCGRNTGAGNQWLQLTWGCPFLPLLPLASPISLLHGCGCFGGRMGDHRSDIRPHLTSHSVWLLPLSFPL